MKKNIIVGKNSFIAKNLLKKNKRFICTSSKKDDVETYYLDLKQANNFNYEIITKETLVVFLAAVSSPDQCDNNYDEAYKINVTGTKYFISEVLKREGKVLFFSSDVVYGNTLEKVNEESLTNPFGNYAKMKDEVEKTFQGKKNFKVFRLSYVLSKDDKYLSYLKSCIDENNVADVFHPFNRKVVYLKDVLDAIEAILERWDAFDNQKFNICGEDTISRKDIADFYNEFMGNKLKYTLSTPGDEFWEARPKDIYIESKYIQKLLGRKTVAIKKAIKQIIGDEKE